MTISIRRPELSAKSFIHRYNSCQASLRERLEQLILQPGSDEIHDVRIAIRRFRIVSELLPKSVRRGGEAREYILACRKLFRATARIRDLDIISERLTEYADRDALTELSRLAGKQRLAGMPQVRACGLSLRHTEIPGISPRQINGIKLNRRIGAVLERTTSACDDELWTAAGDANNIEALHSLRKSVRRLRYTLELLPENTELAEALKKLAEWQRVLGSIRDIDITLDYLKTERPVHSLDGIREKALRDRGLKYTAFLKMPGEYNAIDGVRSLWIVRRRKVPVNDRVPPS